MLQQPQEEYKGFRQPGLRLSEALAPNVQSHRSEKELPRLYALHLFDKAHVVMLTEEGIIPHEDGVAILKSLREIEKTGVEKARLESGGGMHSGEQYLIRTLGESVAGRMHAGRSSGDLGEVSNNIYIRDHLMDVMMAVNNLREVLIATARTNMDVVMPGYTFGQHAQPTTLGHQMLSWVSTLERDLDRLKLCFEHSNQSPAGAAIFTGSDFPVNRHRVAKLLGFQGVEKNTFDAILSYDLYYEVLAVLAILHQNLSRFSSDLILWSISEFNFIEIPDRFCATSSIMPQKKNVIAPQWVKGGAAATVGGLVTAFIVEKDPTGLPIMEHHYSRLGMIQSFKDLARDLGLLAEMLPTIKPNKELMLERAGAFWAQAADLAGMLVRENGLPWRTAHQIIAITVRLSYERGLSPKDLTSELLDEASNAYMGHSVTVSEKALQEALDPAASVSRRTIYGGPAPSEVEKRIPEYVATLEEDIAMMVRAKSQVKSGLDELEKAIDVLIAEES